MGYSKGVESFFITLFFVIILGIFIYILSSVFYSNRALKKNYVEESSNLIDNNNNETHTDSNTNTNSNNNPTINNKENTTNNENVEQPSPAPIKKTEEKIKISSYSTSIYDNAKNRKYNLKLACSKLNGYVIKANHEFSFNKALGPMGKDAGYKKATGFDSNGNNIKVYAGGMCQLSSTTYNTALIAKLKVTERHAHSKRVSYVPKGKDATIYYGSLDLKFINTNDFDIEIKAFSNGGKVTVEMYKISSGI